MGIIEHNAYAEDHSGFTEQVTGTLSYSNTKACRHIACLLPRGQLIKAVRLVMVVVFGGSSDFQCGLGAGEVL